MFEKFSRAFPDGKVDSQSANCNLLRSYVEDELQVSVPEELYQFWKFKGSGYFGERMLYFFGDGISPLPRDSLKAWNNKDFWRSIYPSPDDGGPVFFSETCFGDQIGFRWENGKCIYILFAVDTFDAFILSDSGRELFEIVMSNKYAFVDEERYLSVLNRLGPLKSGMHYAPTVSPLLGGSGEAENFAFETANVHFRTAIYTFQTKQPPKIG